MPFEFHAKIDPPAALADQIADLTPDNPFYTSNYNLVRSRMGSIPYALWIEEAGRAIEGCSAFLSNGWLNSRIEITSLPTLSQPEIFWRGVFDLCRTEGISSLSVQTFASTRAEIPSHQARIAVRPRFEFRIDLRPDDLLGKAHRLHRRKVKAAAQEGLTIRIATDQGARRSHVQLANRSLDRRRGRGFSIESRIEIAETNAFVDTGAGTIYQAIRGEELMGTMLIAKSRTGGYAQSSGTSDAGREIGASHFLFYKTACLLKDEGFETFNIGGADERSKGLLEFKRGTGAQRIELESAEFYVGSQVRRFATRAAALLAGG